MSVIDTLKALAITIRNENKKEANTAVRIGDMFLAIIDFLSGLISGQIRQESVDTYNDTSGGKTSLFSSYPNPQTGWTVYVRSVNTDYQWNGISWIDMERYIPQDEVLLKDGYTGTANELNAQVLKNKNEIKDLNIISNPKETQSFVDVAGNICFQIDNKGYSSFIQLQENLIYNLNRIKMPVVNNKVTVTGHYWTGKKMVAIGDSITQLATYIQPTVEALQLGAIVNISNGGRMLSRDTNQGGDSSMNTDVVINTIPADADLIIVMGGTNDWGQSVAIGTINDMDNTTFMGALKIIIQKISTRYPTARLLLVCPPYAENPSRVETGTWTDAIHNLNGDTMVDYGNAIENIGKLYGIPFANICAEAGWNTYNIRSFMNSDTDLIHPSQLGGNRIASVLVGKINSLINIL